MRVTLVHNSGAGTPAYRTPGAITELLRRYGHEVEYVAVADGWERALQDPGDLVVVAGGDGTVTEVLRRMSEASTPATILPIGTANNVAASLGITGSPAAIVRRWPRFRPRPFDLGRLHGLDRRGERSFVEAVGLGALTEMIGALDGAAGNLNATIRRHEGIGGYVALLRSMLDSHGAREWRVVIDGEDRSGAYLMVEVLNVGLVGPNLRLGATADPGDGLLDVLLVGERERPALEAFLEARIRGEPNPPELPTLRASRVEIAGEPLKLRRDDRVEIAEGGGPVLLRAWPDALRVLAPSLRRPRRRGSAGR